MKKKNGFVFIETMVVVVVLLTILLTIYSSYTGFISIERKRARYDDPAFIYKTYAVGQFLSQFKTDDNQDIIGKRISTIGKKNDNDPSKITKFVVINPSNADLYENSKYENNTELADNKNIYEVEFENLYNDLNIQNIILTTTTNIDGLAKTVSEENKTSDIEISNDLFNYMKTIDISDDLSKNEDNAYLIISYVENAAGAKCDLNRLLDGKNDSSSDPYEKCVFYYSYLKLDKKAV